MERDVDAIARELFNAHIKQGNKLSEPQLKKLNSNWKKDYAEQQFREG